MTVSALSVWDKLDRALVPVASPDGDYAMTCVSPTLPFFPGGIDGWAAVYRAGTAGDSASQWTDYSGNGRHATQPSVGAQLTLHPSIGGRTAFIEDNWPTQGWFILPSSVSIDRQSHGIYAVARVHAVSPLTLFPQALYSFGPNLTDMSCQIASATGAPAGFDFTAGGVRQTPVSPLAHTGLSVIIVSASASGVVARINGAQVTLNPFPAGTLSGGFIGKRTDAVDWGGEFYAFGVLPRPFGPDEMVALEADAIRRYGRLFTFPKELVIAGDSLSAGYLAAGMHGWASVIDTAIGDSWQQLNQASPGNDETTMLSSAATLKLTYDAAKSKHVAILFGGTNDIAIHGFTGSGLLALAQSWLTAMSGAGWSTLVCTITPRADAAWLMFGTSETYRLQYNAGLSGLTGLTAVVDTAGLSQMSDPTNLTYFSADKLHWTTAGHAAVAALIQAAILAV